jgi:hypothetical protein
MIKKLRNQPYVLEWEQEEREIKNEVILKRLVYEYFDIMTYNVLPPFSEFF